jgi:hypothetical protein
MSNQLREAVTRKKQDYITKLLEAGIYKASDRQLYELTLSELEQEFQFLSKTDER